MGPSQGGCLYGPEVNNTLHSLSPKSILRPMISDDNLRKGVNATE